MAPPVWLKLCRKRVGGNVSLTINILDITPASIHVKLTVSPVANNAMDGQERFTELARGWAPSAPRVGVA